MITQTKRLIIIVLTTVILLLIPFIAMQLTNEVNWTLSDFIIAWVLLLGTGISCEIVIRKFSNKRIKIAVCVAIILTLIIVWGELAVGLFGTPLGGQ